MGTGDEVGHVHLMFAFELNNKRDELTPATARDADAVLVDIDDFTGKFEREVLFAFLFGTLAEEIAAVDFPKFDTLAAKRRPRARKTRKRADFVDDLLAVGLPIDLKMFFVDLRSKRDLCFVLGRETDPADFDDRQRSLEHAA